MEDIDFIVDFVVENSNKLQKLGLEGKVKMFTFGLVAQVTQVIVTIGIELVQDVEFHNVKNESPNYAFTQRRR